ncbi:hypothetical protein [Geomobilimonas luticola]|uniref:Uncharacterized protein n=1 Tax=Geomobilimonas luticola TaxID=1114878 RepID=A0ABS5SAM4_9BACT|nr:hypothetical protein [Geomobilimonas luticola]MBT0652423.1 hypothetical protein [Geomobilimonas luticola]
MEAKDPGKETMKPSRIALYIIIGLLVVMIAYSILVKEPPPGWPINLIHLLFGHR